MFLKAAERTFEVFVKKNIIDQQENTDMNMLYL